MQKLTVPTVPVPQHCFVITKLSAQFECTTSVADPWHFGVDPTDPDSEHCAQLSWSSAVVPRAWNLVKSWLTRCSCMTNESGSGSRRPKSLRIRRIRIRIRNTEHNYREALLWYLERGTWWSHDWRGAPASSWCPGSLRERSDAPGIKHFTKYRSIRGAKCPVLQTGFVFF